MKSIKAAGIGWGLIDFAMGAITTLTINSYDPGRRLRWSSDSFSLPLPISLIAVWLPRTAGSALLCCIAANVVAVVAVVAARHTYPIADIGQFIAFIVLYSPPASLFRCDVHQSGATIEGYWS